MDKWNKWIRYTVCIIIGLLSGSISLYDFGQGYIGPLIYQPPLFFFIANVIVFYNILKKSLANTFGLLVSFGLIYLVAFASFGLLNNFSMVLGGVFTLLSYQIVEVKIKAIAYLICLTILFFIGCSLMLLWELFHDIKISYFCVILWHPVVLTTVAISVQKAEEEEVIDDLESFEETE